MANISPTQDSLAQQEPQGLVGNLMSRIRSLLKGKNGDSTFRESLEDIIEEDEHSAQELRDEERHMLINILNFGELRVEDVMVPRADINGVELETSIEDLARLFCDAAHSRLPVYRGSLDDPIGMVHIKDVIGHLTPGGPNAKSADADHSSGERSALSQLRRDVLFVPPSMPVSDLFVKMQTKRIHMALVIDEYGGTDGLVTIEDLVEEIVGEIEDEHDIDETPIVRERVDGSYDAEARVPIEDLEQLLEVSLVPDDRDEDIDTLGGLVFSLVGRVPERGELITHPAGIDFEVVDADPRRIKRLRIYAEQSAAKPADDSDSGISTED